MSAFVLLCLSVGPALGAPQLSSPQLLSAQFFNATLAHGVDVNIWGAAKPNAEVQVTVGVGAAVTTKVANVFVLKYNCIGRQ